MEDSAVEAPSGGGGSKPVEEEHSQGRFRAIGDSTFPDGARPGELSRRDASHDQQWATVRDGSRLSFEPALGGFPPARDGDLYPYLGGHLDAML